MTADFKQKKEKALKALLINPPIRVYDAADIIPFGLAYVAKVLLNAGHQIEILDNNAYRLAKAELLDRIDKTNFDVIGIGGLVTVYPYVKWLASALKAKYPRVPIVVGGSVGSSIPHIMLEKTSVDVVVMGEGEETALELLPKLASGEDIGDVRGIAYRRDGRVVLTAPRPRIADLDSIPLPAYEILPMDIYLKNNQTDPYIEEFRRRNRLPSGPAPAVTVITGRGCPYQCAFCYHQMGRLSYKHSVGYVLDHFEHLRDSFGISRFIILDELFTVKRSWTLEFCDRLMAENMQVFFRCSARTNTVDRETLTRLRQVGCYNLSYGIESGSQRMLDSMKKKGTNVEISKEALRLTSEAGITMSATFIFGMPGESAETMRETARWAVEAGMEDIGGFFATPYPGTELYTYAKERNLIADEEQFIESLGDSDAVEFRINLTDMPDVRLKYLIARTIYDVRKQGLKKKRRYLRLFKLWLDFYLMFLRTLKRRGLKWSLVKTKDLFAFKRSRRLAVSSWPRRP